MADDNDKQLAGEPETAETAQPASAPEGPVAPAAPASAEASSSEVEVPSAEAVTESAAAPAEDSPAAEPEPKRKRKRVPRPLRRQRSKPVRATASDGERKPIVRLPKPERERGRRQERRGVVVSSAMDKTIVVKVDTVKAHRKYKKVVRRSEKFHAHDEENRANVGDVVRIVETRPLSRTKHWRLAEVVEEAR
jgi:small subunit ribosomal protein S17